MSGDDLFNDYGSEKFSKSENEMKKENHQK